MEIADLDAEQFDSSLLKWIARTYESHEEWKIKAREIFYNSNGDSDLARQRLASVVRTYFVNEKLSAYDVDLWSGNTTSKVRIEPPIVSASNAGYFDWLLVADYLLLPCGAVVEKYQEENQQREKDYQQLLGSFNLRTQVMFACGLIRQHPELADQKVLAKVQENHPNASLANIKEARRLEAKGSKLRMPIEPKKAALMPLYKPLYF